MSKIKYIFFSLVVFAFFVFGKSCFAESYNFCNWRDDIEKCKITSDLSFFNDDNEDINRIKEYNYFAISFYYNYDDERGRVFEILCFKDIPKVKNVTGYSGTPYDNVYTARVFFDCEGDVQESHYFTYSIDQRKILYECDKSDMSNSGCDNIHVPFYKVDDYNWVQVTELVFSVFNFDIYFEYDSSRTYDIKANFSGLTPPDGQVGDKSSLIGITWSINESKTQCLVSASIKNATDGDELYYWFEGDVEKKKYEKNLILTDNVKINFEARHSNGEVFSTNFLQLNGLNHFSSQKFKINYEEATRSIIFTANLLDNFYNYYDIYLKIGGYENVEMHNTSSDRSTDIASNYVDFNKISNGTKYIIYNKTTSENVDDIQVKLFYEVRNKVTGKTLCTRYDVFKLNGVPEHIDSNDDDSYASGLLENLDKNSSLKDIMNSVKDTFDTFKVLFSILPGFIWAFIGSALVVIIVMRLLGR